MRKFVVPDRASFSHENGGDAHARAYGQERTRSIIVMRNTACEGEAD
jgi:hypothetical protein